MNTAVQPAGTLPTAAAAAGNTGAGACTLPVVCHPSIARRLARAMSVLVLLGLGLLSVAKYSITAMQMRADQQATLTEKGQVLAGFIADACKLGEGELLRKLALFEPVRGNTRLQLWRGNATPLYNDGVSMFERKVTLDFVVPTSAVAGGHVQAHLEVDTTHDHRMLRGMAFTLVVTTLLGSAAAGLVIRWLVRRELAPLMSLAGQTRAISPQRLDQRLTLARPADELVPWVEQFNALMARLQQAYGQMEAFNADVAHELRTPLATLIGQTELALSRERSPEALREILASNLEEMQRLSALVNDMLFVSQADRGAAARRGAPVSLATLAAQVAEFHEATLEDAGLTLRIEGDARLPVDEPLVKRALSNLIGNATRFAERGSTVVVAVARQPDGAVQLSVANAGPGIAAEHLPRLFDRFFRVDESRCCEGAQHHGLGLAIVAAIARMHGGQTLAESADGRTRVGFTLGMG